MNFYILGSRTEASCGSLTVGMSVLTSDSGTSKRLYKLECIFMEQLTYWPLILIRKFFPENLLGRNRSEDLDKCRRMIYQLILQKWG